MTGPFIAVVAAAGFLAGVINTVVGSGSLLTFPALLAAGYPPLVANVSNTVGVLFGSVSGAIGYRRELSGQMARLIGLGAFSLAGGLTGAILLLVLPSAVFRNVVPVLVLLAVVLVVVQPHLNRLLAHRRHGTGGAVVLRVAVFLAGVYGGYFGAAQGVLLIGILGILVADDMQRLNGLKNVLATLVNGVAALVFVIRAPVAWEPVLIIAISGIIGGQVGAHVGRRLPPGPLRAVIVVGGLVVVVKLLLFPT